MPETATPELVRELPENVPSLDWLDVAAHEIGHALMADYVDIPIRDARIDTSWWDGRLTGGTTRPKHDTNPEDEDTDGNEVDGLLKVYLAGNEAGAYLLDYYLDIGMPLAREHESTGSASDFEGFRKYLKYGTKPSKLLQRETEQFVRRNWKRIHRYAIQLAHKRVMAGSKIRA